ncbi:MAG: carboxymuconolactone decarboxylase family protein [Armatimonadetes bacterium]|nr:carboxymuconolactone decarboxylase family protein [Armatimonadota bacterium]
MSGWTVMNGETAMSRLLSEEEANGKVAEVYADIREEFGSVPNFFKAQAAVDADWLEVNWQREKVIMLSSGGLDRKTRELIAYAVSEVNRNEYCILAHEGMAREQRGHRPGNRSDQTDHRAVLQLQCNCGNLARAD